MRRELELGAHALAVALEGGDALHVRRGLVDHLGRALHEQADLVGGPESRADAPRGGGVVALPVGRHEPREQGEGPDEPRAEEDEKHDEARDVDGGGHGEGGAICARTAASTLAAGIETSTTQVAASTEAATAYAL